MLSQINSHLENIIRDIRYQRHLHRLKKTIEGRLELAEEDRKKAEKEVRKAEIRLNQMRRHSAKSAFFNLIGQRKKGLAKEEKAYQKAQSYLAELATEITHYNQEIYSIDQEIEDLKPLRELEEELRKIKEEFLLKNNPQYFETASKIENLKLDIKELIEAVQSMEIYIHHLYHLGEMLEYSFTWKHLENAAKMVRKIENLSKDVETEILDVVDRIPLEMKINPHQLGRFWVKNKRFLEWNYEYEYSRNSVQQRTIRHEAQIQSDKQLFRGLVAQKRRELRQAKLKKRVLVKRYDKNQVEE